MDALKHIDPSIIASIITASSGILIGILTAFRANRIEKDKNNYVEKSALLDIYTNIIKTLQDELLLQVEQHSSDRENWRAQTHDLQQEIDLLQAEQRKDKEEDKE